MAKPTLLPDPTCLHLKLLDASEAAITAVVTATSEETECPRCALAFSADSLALYALGRRSALDGLCGEPATTWPKLRPRHWQP